MSNSRCISDISGTTQKEIMKKISIFTTVFMLLYCLIAEYSTAYILEGFNSESSTLGFKSSGNWRISEGALHYDNPNPQKYYYTWFGWNGGENPGGWAPSLKQSNYFYEFAVSVIVNCEKTPDNKFYGLYACGQQTQNNQADIIMFRISLNGYYRVEVLKDGKWDFYTGYIKSGAITGKNDRLTILKQGNLFRFFINYNEVEFLKFDKHFGGSVGIVSEDDAKPWFDNFEVVNLANQQPVYKPDAGTLNISRLDILNAGGLSGAYSVSLNSDGLQPASFNLVEAEVFQSSENFFSWHDIFNKISLSSFRPSFDFKNNTMQLPSVRQEESTGAIKLIKMTLNLENDDKFVRLKLNSLNEYIPDCSAVDQNLWIYNRMKDIYYWYDKIPKIDSKKYSSPEKLLEEIKYKTLDKWSYITNKSSYSSLFEEGTYIGIGYGSKYDDKGNLRISHVYPNSPVERAGVKRGWKLLKINDKSVEEIENNKLWNEIYGEDRVGVVVDLQLEDLKENVVEISLLKEKVKINTVFHYDTFNIDNKKVGYLVFMSFLQTSEDELDKVFQYFKQNNIAELILDLRYNTGGLVSIAASLASLISGDKTDGKTFASVKYNKNHKNDNYNYIFSKKNNSLNLSRIIVITGASTCSASELVINGLNPFLDVVTIGNTTCGKPVGMSSQFFCDKVLQPITFETVNDEGKGGYFKGIEPDYKIADDLTLEFGDPNETSLMEALYYLENGKFSSSSRIADRIQPSVSSKEQSVSGFKKFIGSF
ncbi:MAG: hypothetical protein HQK69_07790 [Desulfamplus sp.]|nr:hypothetical protein [Desulfamplus sp.]